jgi:DNA-binding beta-propeller fold protein YncE
MIGKLYDTVLGMRFLRISLVAFFSCWVLAAEALPEISYDSTANFLKLPDNIYLGEVAGVATTSKGHIIVYTRTGTVALTEGTAYPYERGSSRLFEFDATGKYVREIAPGLYAYTFAQGVRVDAQDNIWIVDQGSNMILKMNPEGRVVMAMGRKPESVPNPARPGGGGRANKEGHIGAGLGSDVFNRPTDVAFDSQGDFFVADGFGNSRVAKFNKDGVFLKSWGWKGSGQAEFNLPHSIATDSQGNVYVADQGNKRIQVFDNDGHFKTQIANIGAPAAICISSDSHEYLFSSNSNDPSNLDNGEIYKMELDGRVLGKFGRAGKIPKEFGSVNAIDCRSSSQLYVGEIQNWRVQKLILH